MLKLESSSAGDQTADTDVRQALARFFARTAAATPLDTGDDSQELLSSGLLDSLAMVQLTMFLADEVGFELSDEDFTEANFATLGSLVRLVNRKRTVVP